MIQRFVFEQSKLLFLDPSVFYSPHLRHADIQKCFQSFLNTLCNVCEAFSNTLL